MVRISKNNVLKNLSSCSVCKNNITHKINKIYSTVNGVCRLVWEKTIKNTTEIRIKKANNASELSIGRKYMGTISTSNYAFFGGGHSASASVSAAVDVYNSSLVHQIVDDLCQSRYWNYYPYLSATFVGKYALFGPGSTLYGSYTGFDVYDNSLTHTNQSDVRVASHIYASTCGNCAFFSTSSTSRSVIAIDTSLTFFELDAFSARSFMGAGTCGNYATFIGGYDSPTYSDLIDVYDSSMTHSYAPALHIARQEPACASSANYMFVAGGLTVDGSTTYLSEVEVYDLSLTHKLISSLKEGRNNVAGSNIGNGYVAFAGGKLTASTYTSIVDIYDNSLTKISIDNCDLDENRRNHSMCSVGNYALIGGGQTPSSKDNTSVEIFECW